MTEHEMWIQIHDFPDYSVSSYGRVKNNSTGRILQTSNSSRYASKVGLVLDGRQYTRLVKTLVTDAFLPDRTDIFNTAIHLDGDKTNNDIYNLEWRPRWFAVKYARQFIDDYPHVNRGPIKDIHTNHIYKDVYEVATTHGLLFKDVFSGCLTNEPVFPTWQTFEWVH